MFKVVAVRNNIFSVLDTDDGVVDDIAYDKLSDLVQNKGIKVSNFEEQRYAFVLDIRAVVLCIFIGMRKMTKPLRIYGLILALCSAVKLVLFDISYSYSISKTFSYIVCGVLCFVISYIYTRLERSSINN